MEGTIVFLSLGSNDPQADSYLRLALAGISSLSGCAVMAVSSLYRTEPQGLKNQPWFSNMVIKAAVAPHWRPGDFLKELLAIETGLGRKRPADPALRFGPRKIDIDLLIFGEERSDEPQCLLPHPRMARRAFVLLPLLEIEPGICLGGREARDLLAELSWRLEGNKIFQD